MVFLARLRPITLVGLLLVAGCSLHDDPVDDGSAAGADSYPDSPVFSDGSVSAEFVPDEPRPLDDAVANAARLPLDVVAAHGTRLYAHSRYGSFLVIDQSKPQSPRVIGRLPLLCRPFALLAHGGDVVALCDALPHRDRHLWGGEAASPQRALVHLIDVSTPSAPTLRSSTELAGALRFAGLDGQRALAVTARAPCGHCPESPGIVVSAVRLDTTTLSSPQELALGGDPSDPATFAVLAAPGRLFVSLRKPSHNGRPDRSWLQVVDTNTADGLRSGTAVPLAGIVSRDAQLNIDQGTLRVVQDPVPGVAEQRVVLQTYSLDGSLAYSPTATIPLSIEGPLSAARFDATRAYFSGGLASPTLVVVDLEDPSAPAERAVVPLPSPASQLLPSGDRLLALGATSSSPTAARLVSLFDITAPASLTLLSSVSFGGASAEAPAGSFVGDALAVSADGSIIAAPFSTWNGVRSDEEGRCGRYEGSAQLIARLGDDLSLRGVASAHGAATSASFEGQRLQLFTDEALTGFDVTNPEAPIRGGDAPLLDPVSRVLAVDDLLVTLSADHWRRTARLDVRPLDAPSHQPPIGSVDLSTTVLASRVGCLADTVLKGASLFALDRALAIVVSDPAHVDASRVITVDLHEPTAPRLLSEAAFPFVTNLGPRRLPAGAPASSAVVDLGSPVTLCRGFLATLWSPDRSAQGTSARVELVDISDPAHPALRDAIDVPTGVGGTRLFASYRALYTSHVEPIEQYPDKAAFFVDQIALASDGPPTLLPPYELPGSLASISKTGDRALAVHYARVWISDDGEGCQARPGLPWPFGRFVRERGGCVEVRRQLGFFDLSGKGPGLRGRLWLDDERHHADEIVVAGGIVLAIEIEALGGASMRTGLTHIVAAPQRPEVQPGAIFEEGASSIRTGRIVGHAAGVTVVHYARPFPELVLLEQRSDAHSLDLRTIPLPHALHEVAIAGDRAFVAMQPYGLATVELRHR